MRGGVVPTNEEVDGVRLARAQGLGEGAPDPGCGCRGAQGVEIADLVQSDVAFDEFGELEGVAWRFGRRLLDA